MKNYFHEKFLVRLFSCFDATFFKSGKAVENVKVMAKNESSIDGDIK